MTLARGRRSFKVINSNSLVMMMLRAFAQSRNDGLLQLATIQHAAM